MKGIETQRVLHSIHCLPRSDHCPAMKGIETYVFLEDWLNAESRSDHCPAMKGIETHFEQRYLQYQQPEATTAPQ